MSIPPNRPYQENAASAKTTTEFRFNNHPVIGSEHGFEDLLHVSWQWSYTAINYCHQSTLPGLVRCYRDDHPALAWLLGFARACKGFNPWRFHFQTYLRHKRHFSHVLRKMPNEALQVLLTSSVQLLQSELTTVFPAFGHTISLDTKAILAWILGHDLLTGEKLSHGEELFTAVAIAIPVVSMAAAKYGGRLLRGGQQIATHVDEVGNTARIEGNGRLS